MLTFKDAIKADIDTTFANVNEFFDTLIVDGKPMRVGIDAYDLEGYKGAPGKGEYINGVIQGNVIAYIPEADYGAMPKHGKPIVIAGKRYIVESCSREDGMYTMIIRRNVQ